MTTPAESPSFARSVGGSIDEAVLRTVAYADVFDYPLEAREVYRYLHGVPATEETTARALARSSAPGGALSRSGEFFTLRGREGLVDVRRRRAVEASRLWPVAVRYGRLIAGLPFVRMVAVTGSLAWDNVAHSSDGAHAADIDYLIVTESGRLWLCHGFVAAVGRVARLGGSILCPNYMVSRRALTIGDRNLYAAYELANMTPIAGMGTYRRMRQANAWTDLYLPNAFGPPRLPPALPRPRARGPVLARVARLGEWMLGSRLGDTLERYEMRHRTTKRSRHGNGDGEASYSADAFKDHLRGHRQRTFAAFADRLRDLGARAP